MKSIGDKRNRSTRSLQLGPDESGIVCRCVVDLDIGCFTARFGIVGSERLPLGGRRPPLVQRREDEFLQVEERRLDGHRNEKGQQRHGEQEAQIGVHLVVVGVVNGPPHVAVVERYVLVVDQVDAVGQPTQRNEPAPRQQRVDEACSSNDSIEPQRGQRGDNSVNCHRPP